MPQVTEASLKERARQMLVEMTQRSRWIYALPPGDETMKLVNGAIAESSLPEVDSAADGSVRKYQNEADDQHLLVFDNRDLGVVLVEASGDGVVPLMQRMLERTGFVPQSRLWANALNIGSPEAVGSLTVLSHMAVAWDEDWSDLFIVHLASPDPIVRHEATKSLVVAAMVSGAADAALALLREAQSRERYPKLNETLTEAIQAVEAFAGQPLSGVSPGDAADSAS